MKKMVILMMVITIITATFIVGCGNTTTPETTATTTTTETTATTTTAIDETTAPVSTIEEPIKWAPDHEVNLYLKGKEKLESQYKSGDHLKWSGRNLSKYSIWEIEPAWQWRDQYGRDYFWPVEVKEGDEEYLLASSYGKEGKLYKFTLSPNPLAEGREGEEIPRLKVKELGVIPQ